MSSHVFCEIQSFLFRFWNYLQTWMFTSSFCVFWIYLSNRMCFFFGWYILRLGFILCKIWNHFKVFNKSFFFSLQIIISLCNFTILITLGSSFVCVNFQQFTLYFDVWFFLCITMELVFSSKRGRHCQIE